MTVSLQINGDQDLQRKLARARRTMPRIIVERELHDVANMVRRHAKATRRFQNVTGRLRRSIRIAKDANSEFGYVVRAGNPYAGGVYYAAAIEYGTQHIRPRRFLHAAVQSVRGRALHHIVRSSRRRFTSAARRIFT